MHIYYTAIFVDPNYTRKVVDFQIPIFQESTDAIWQLRFDDIIACALTLGPLREMEVEVSQAVLDLNDPQLDLGSLGTDAAYLAAGLTNIVDRRPVEDCTTKHYRPGRKKSHGQSMGGM